MSELVEILLNKLFNGLNRSALEHLRPQLSWTDLVKPISKLNTLDPLLSIFNCGSICFVLSLSVLIRFRILSTADDVFVV